MARLVLEPTHLAVRLNRWERLCTLRGSFTIPWEDIVYAERSTDMWPRVRGWRFPGLGIPHLLLVGRMKFRGGSDFCALLGTKPGVIVEMKAGRYERLLATAANADQVVDRVTRGS